MLELLKSLTIKVKDIAYKLGLIADYVVEQGSNYIKYSNGRLIQWGRLGSEAISGNVTTTINFPVAFTTQTFTFVYSLGYNGSIAGTHCEGDSGGNNKRTYQSTTITFWKSGGAYNIGINWVAIGTWK